MHHLPEGFKQHVRSVLPAEAEHFFSALFQEPRTAVRLNPCKPTKAFLGESLVSWCEQGRLLQQRPQFIADPLLHAGAYYVQEASSMFLTQAFTSLKANASTPLKVLDACAAPGGKSTLLLSYLDDNDLLVANEIIKTRVTILEENLIKWGRSNVIVTNNDPKELGKLQEFFDVIVIDAPCSGEGMFRKDKKAIEEWSNEHVNLCALRQQRIIDDLLPALKPGGYLIYSTCTFNTQENEAQVARLISTYGMNTVRIPVQPEWKISETTTWNNTPLYAYRFYPHKVLGEGFFLACLQKEKGEEPDEPKLKKQTLPAIKTEEEAILRPWLKQPDDFVWQINQGIISALPVYHVQDMLYLKKHVYVKLAGLQFGQLIKGKLVPDHQLALSVHLSEDVPSIELSRIDALRFLRKETFPLNGYPQGIYLMRYEGMGMGWAKVMPNRMNNYLPVQWRILKDLSDLQVS